MNLSINTFSRSAITFLNNQVLPALTERQNLII